MSPPSGECPPDMMMGPPLHAHPSASMLDPLEWNDEPHDVSDVRIEDADGAPISVGWLAEALAAERASVELLLQRRHGRLLRQLKASACQQGSLLVCLAGEVQGEDQREDSQGSAGSGPPKGNADSCCAESVLWEAPRRQPEETMGERPVGAKPSVEVEGPRQDQEQAKPQPLRDSERTKLHASLSFTKESSQEADATTWSSRLVRNPAFELAVVAVIIINSMVIAAQIQYDGIGIGHDLKYPNYQWQYPTTKEEAWVHFEDVSQALDYVFGVIYVAELLVKIHALRLAWFRDLWNYFDFLIVGFWLYETMFSNGTLPIDDSALRTARLFRLLRLVKVLKTLQGFDSLYMLVTTLKGSMRILCWSVILLFIVQMLIAFIICFILKDYYTDEYYPLKDRQEVFQYFGSFSRAMLSMFEMTLANWPPVCRLLVENVNEWFMLFCLAHKLTIGFAVIGVINGVFMQETFKVSSNDDAIMIRRKEHDVRIWSAKVHRLFQATDHDGDGVVDHGEFHAVMRDPDIKMWMSSLDLPVGDPDALFELLDADETGELTPEEMVRGVLRLRGAAKSVDLIAFKKQLDRLQRTVVASLDRGGESS